MNLKAAFLACVSALTVGVMPAAVNPAKATPATGDFNSHLELYQTIHAYGVKVLINSPEYCDGRVDGSYISTLRILNVCQDNARPGEAETTWSENDLDTLRHEAHHMIQDCAGGGHANGHLVHLFSDRSQLLSFIQNVLGEEEAKRLMTSDSYQGHNRERQLIELEAFATAAVISARDITDKMIQVCR